MRIQRIILKNWKNFPKADLRLLGRTFVIGANASGKSNLLDVFRFLRDIAQGQGGGLQQALKDRGGLSNVRCYAARSKPVVEIEVHLGKWDDDIPLYTYKLGLTQEKRGYHRPIVKFEEVTVKGQTVLSRPNADDVDDPERLTETHLEQTSANKEFREVADFFKSICYLHIVPQMIRSPETGMSSSATGDPFGRSFLELLAKTPDKTRRGRLKKIESALKVIVPQLTELEFHSDLKGQPHLVASHGYWRSGAGQQNETQFSDGTLRVIGLLWMLQEETSVILIEEPELSLNNEIIKQMAGLFAGIVRKNKRQMIISTHSQELLSDSGIAPEEVVVLTTHDGGTHADVFASEVSGVKMYQSGLSMAEVALPLAAPKNAGQLCIQFDDNGSGSK